MQRQYFRALLFDIHLHLINLPIRIDDFPGGGQDGGHRDGVAVLMEGARVCDRRHDVFSKHAHFLATEIEALRSAAIIIGAAVGRQQMERALRLETRRFEQLYENMPLATLVADADENGHWVVDKVYQGSPAEKAGFQKGDVLLAVNGVKYSKDNKRQLKETYAKFEPGTKTTYWVKRQGEKVELEATLGSVPKDLQKQWIAEHMQQHHPDYQMASK